MGGSCSPIVHTDDHPMGRITLLECVLAPPICELRTIVPKPPVLSRTRCWCEDDTVCAAQENSIVVVPKVSYIFFHVPVQMFVLESAMLHFLTTICFALPVCLFGLQSDTWPTLLAHN